MSQSHSVSEGRQNRKLESVEDLEIWQKANFLCDDLLRQSKSFPISEWQGLAQRVKNCAIDVPVEIEKGFLKRNIPDKIIHYHKAQDAYVELKYLIKLSVEYGYLKKPESLLTTISEIDQMFTGLIRSMEKRTGNKPRGNQYQEHPASNDI